MFFSSKLSLSHLSRAVATLSRGNLTAAVVLSPVSSSKPTASLIMCAKRSLSTELVKSARVATGVGIYQQLQQLRPEVYQFAPPEGLELTVDYADTASEGQEFEKVIVAVHGCPGYYTNFDRLIEHFRHSKVRVIAPNLPDFSHTRSTQTFWHSTAEKALFLKDFLRQLGVTTIDCLVSHSFGIQTIAALWEDVSHSLTLCIIALTQFPLFNPTLAG